MALATQQAQEEHTALQQLLNEHLTWLRIKGYSDYTVRSRFVHIRFFLRWCGERRISVLEHITPCVLHEYQQHALDYRKRNGKPLALSSRYALLVPLRVWFRWMTQQHLISDRLVSAIELPRLGRPLPRSVLSAREIERVLSQPDI